MDIDPRPPMDLEPRRQWADDRLFTPGVLWTIAALMAVGIGVAVYFLYFKPEAPLAQQEAPPPAAAPEAPPAIQHPLPTPPATEPVPLPALAESDAPMLEAVGGLVGKEAATSLLVPDGMVRRFVVTIDNLPRKKIALQVRPTTPVPGVFLTAGSEDELTLSADNYARYAAFMKVVEATDTQQLAAFYQRFYPLFQESYEGLGYPERYFNDRVVEVIDHLLATPEVQGPVRLTQPHVFYEFADPRLEALSAGQKVLIRMGSDNAAIVKKKLAALRREIARPATR
jgi:Protein of unknown function (DUF3014)